MMALQNLQQRVSGSFGFTPCHPLRCILAMSWRTCSVMASNCAKYASRVVELRNIRGNQPVCRCEINSLILSVKHLLQFALGFSGWWKLAELGLAGSRLFFWD